MYLFSIWLFFPAINALITTQIHQNAIYRFRSSCALIGNLTLSNDASIQSCIWSCVHEQDCQTAVYFKDEHICSMYSELCEQGSIESSENVSANVICYRKSHNPLTVCSTTVATKDREETSQMQIITTIDSTSYWPFDNNTHDVLSQFDGIMVNNASYKTPGINGYGSALSVNRSQNQSVEVQTYRNLTYRSFTVEMWFYCINLIVYDSGLFGQYYASTNDQSLHFVVRNDFLYMDFFGDDLLGSTTIQINSWYHVAFVYDYSSSTQSIYLNGILDGNRNKYLVYIDEVYLTMRAKNVREILDDETLVCWYSFDNGSHYDSGPLHLIGTGVNISYVGGRVNQSIQFNSNSSYFQIYGFVLLGIFNSSYSIALWIYPIVINGSTIVHRSTTRDGQDWCLDLIGLSSIGQIVLTVSNDSSGGLVGPVIPINTWTHIVYTYSSIRGLQLYINGTFNSTAGPMAYLSSNDINILTLGNPLQANMGNSCITQPILPNVFNGSIDEFRVYFRELNSSDVHQLANP